MKNRRTEVESYLRAVPEARERSNKDRAIVNLLMRKYPLLRTVITEGRMNKELVIKIVQDYASMDRAWRKTLEDVPELRGSDYKDKVRLETEARETLGYNH